MPLPPSEIDQKNIFAALVRAQDTGASVKESRAKIAEAYGLNVEEIIQIERYGVAAKWPPLDVPLLAPEPENKPTE